MNSLNIIIIILDLFILGALFYYYRKLIIIFKDIVYYLRIERKKKDKSKTFNDSDFSMSNRSLLQIVRGKEPEQSTLNTNEEKRNFLLIHCLRIFSNYHYVSRFLKIRNMNNDDKCINNELQNLSFVFCIFTIMQLSIFFLSIKDDISKLIIIAIMFSFIHFSHNYSLVFIFTKQSVKIIENDFSLKIEIYLLLSCTIIFISFIIGFFLIIFDPNINIKVFFTYFVVGVPLEMFLRSIFLVGGLVILLIYLKLTKKDLSLYFKDEIEQEGHSHNFNSFIKYMKEQIAIQKELDDKKRMNKLINRKLNTMANNDIEKEEIESQRSVDHKKDHLIQIKELKYTCLDFPAKENNKKKEIKMLQSNDSLADRQKE